MNVTQTTYFLQHGDGTQKRIQLVRKIASGGEGTIHEIAGMEGKVAKIFHKKDIEKHEKLCAMLANPPESVKSGHTFIAWPEQLIFDEQQDLCVGFTMPYIDPMKSHPLLKVYNPLDRSELGLDFTWEYLVVMAYNLSVAVQELHKRGYVIGDLNESNVLVTEEANVTLVDCDSMQVPGSSKFRFGPKNYFLCTVGKPEYTPPELQGKNFSNVKRGKRHDNFALAVLIFLMLMEGRHPFAIRWLREGEPPTTAKSIKKKYFPYDPVVHKKYPHIDFPLYAVPFGTLPREIRDLMLRCFVARTLPYDDYYREYRGKDSPLVAVEWRLLRLGLFLVSLFRCGQWVRPGAKRWIKALEYTENNLTDCKNEGPLLPNGVVPNYEYHTYSNQLTGCPWCDRITLGIPEPFPSVGKHNPAKAARLARLARERERKKGTSASPVKAEKPRSQKVSPVAPTSLKKPLTPRSEAGIGAAVGIVFLVIIIIVLIVVNTTVISPQHIAATATADVLAKAVSGKPTLVDTLQDDTKGYWPMDTQHHSCQFINRSYHILRLSSSPQTCVSSAPELKIKNAVLQVEVSSLAGNDVGLVFRANSKGFYDFGITDQGTFFFRRYDTGKGYTNLIPNTFNYAISSSSPNILVVIASGSDFKFYINTTFVGEKHDATYTSGQVGFAAGALDSGTSRSQGSFSNLKIYPSPSA